MLVLLAEQRLQRKSKLSYSIEWKLKLTLQINYVQDIPGSTGLTYDQIPTDQLGSDVAW
jgi:hypothetical protein